MEQQTKDKIRYYTDLVRYYLFHPVRSVIFYFGFCYAALASIYMLPDSDPDRRTHTVDLHAAVLGDRQRIFAFGANGI